MVLFSQDLIKVSKFQYTLCNNIYILISWMPFLKKSQPNNHVCKMR